MVAEIAGTVPLKVRVFLYLRTSTDQQDDSPEIQEAKLRDHCQRQGWVVVGVYYDIVTGKAGMHKRPRFRQMLEDAQLHQVQGFLALVWDRFLRSTRVKAQMEERLIQDRLFIMGIDDNLRMGVLPGQQRQRAGEKAMVNMTTTMAQYYSDFVSDKLIDHIEHRVKKSLHHSGPPPFGYKPMKDAYLIDGRAFDGWAHDDTPDGTATGVTTAERFAWIIDRFIECENLIQVASELTALGVPTPRLGQWNRLSKSEQARRIEIQQKNRGAGHKTMQLPPSPIWDSSVLSDMVRSRTYLGMNAYTPQHLQIPGKKKAKNWYRGRHDPLLTQEKFDQVQAILDKRGQHQRKPATKRSDVLLNGMLLCTCGYAMTFNAKDTKGQKLRYICNLGRKTRGAACDAPMFNSRVVDSLVQDLLLRGLKVRLNELRAATAQVIDSPMTGELDRELAELKVKRELILDNYTDRCYGEGPEAKAKRDTKLAPVMKRIDEIEKDIAPVDPTTPNELEQALINIESHWEVWPISVRRDILRTYVPGSFQLRKDRTLRAEVCGVLLEVDIPLMPQATKGMRYGGRSKDAQNKKGLTVEACQTDSVVTPTLVGVTVGAAGLPRGITPLFGKIILRGGQRRANRCFPLPWHQPIPDSRIWWIELGHIHFNGQAAHRGP